MFFATNAYGADSRYDIEVIFEKGRAHYVDNKLFVNDEIVCYDVTVSGEKAYWGESHAELIKNFYENNIYYSVTDAENTMRTVFAMYESASVNGKSVDVE